MNSLEGGERENLPGEPPDQSVSNETKTRIHERLCLVCRKMSDRRTLIRLTADSATSEIKLNDDDRHLHGRSVYLCADQSCVTQALKGTRLKAALEGRKAKNVQNRRTVKWPLEPQLIQEISERCTEPPKTCQNTER